MSETEKKKIKKLKKKKKEAVKSPPDSESSDEELDLTKECYPIAHYMNDRAEMIAQMFSVIKGGKLKAMLPPVLKDMDLEKLKLKCLDQILGMSEKRIISTIEGEILDSSSESDVVSDDSSDDSDSQQSSDSSKAPSDTEDSKKKKKIKPDPESQPVVQPEPETKPEHQGKTLLEILELEMRARAIRALLKQSETEVKNGQPSVASKSKDSTQTITDTVDLTEPEYPTVVKKEPAPVQEKSFEDKIERAKEKAAENKKRLLAEQEMRSRLIKKKSYRTREQRLENMEPDVPPVPKPNEDSVVEQEVIPLETIKKEPPEIVIDDPEEGEVSSEDEPVLVKLEDVPEESSAPCPTEEPAAKSVEGERIMAFDEGEIVADQNLEWEPPVDGLNVQADAPANESVVLIDQENLPPPVLDLEDSEPVNPSQVEKSTEIEQGNKNITELAAVVESVADNVEPATIAVTGIEIKKLTDATPSIIVEQVNEISELEKAETSKAFDNLAHLGQKRTSNPVEPDIEEVTSITQSSSEQFPVNRHTDADLECITVENPPTTKAVDNLAQLGQTIESSPVEQDIEEVTSIAQSSSDHPSVNRHAEGDLECITVENPLSTKTVDNLAQQSQNIASNLVEQDIETVPSLNQSYSSKKSSASRQHDEVDVDCITLETPIEPPDNAVAGNQLVEQENIGLASSSRKPMIIDLEEDPPCFDLDSGDDDDIIFLENYVSGENSQDVSNDEPINWRGRWLSKAQIQKVVKSSKICALVRKRLKEKKALLKAQSVEEAEAPPVESVEPVVEPVAAPSPPPSMVIEGSVSEYEQLFGKKVVTIEDIVQEVLETMLIKLDNGNEESNGA